jgi:hypothetical protein
MKKGQGKMLDKIVAVLAQHGGPMNGMAIARAIAGGEPTVSLYSSMAHALLSLARDGRIVRDATGTAWLLGKPTP